jgi:hypothetical protein
MTVTAENLLAAELFRAYEAGENKGVGSRL